MSEVVELVKPGAQSWFCRTPTAINILRVVDYCREYKDIGMIVGDPGVGKTTALQWAASNDSNIVYCVLNPAKSALSSVLELICTLTAGHSPNTCAQKHEVVCHWAEWQENALLIVDEAQRLNDVCLDELRCIHDETDLPLIFSGNRDFRTRFNNRKAASFAQFTSRVGMRLDLERPTPADIAALAHHIGTDDPKAITYLERFGNTSGGLRLVSKLLGIGKGLAKDGNVNCDHLKAAAKMLGVEK